MSHPHTDTELVKTALRGHGLTYRPQASRIADRKIVARLFPSSQRHGRAVVILTQSRRRAHDARIHHCDGDCLSMSTLFDEVASAVFDGLPASASRVV
jgi:hypothetical protein